jgi:hypothetical protein
MSVVTVLEACQNLHPDPRPGVARRPLPLIALLRIHLTETPLPSAIRRALASHRVTHILHLSQLTTPLMMRMLEPREMTATSDYLRQWEITPPLNLDPSVVNLVKFSMRPQPAALRIQQDKDDAIAIANAIAWLESQAITY